MDVNKFEECLLKAEEEENDLPWNAYIKINQWCITALTYDTYICDFRKDEKNKGKSISPTGLKLLCGSDIDRYSNKDSFYYPAYFIDKNGNIANYTDDLAFLDLEEIFSPGFEIPKDIIDKDNRGYFYLLSIKKALSVMSNMENPPIKTALWIISLLIVFCKQVISFHEIVKARESLRVQNKKNRASVGRNLRFIEKHPFYKKIESLIESLKSDQTGGEQNKIYAEIDKITRQIIDIENKKSVKTIRRYRNYLLSTSYKNYRLDKESVNRNRVICGVGIDYGQKGVLSNEDN